MSETLLPLLTFFGAPMLMRGAERVSAHFRYQKGLALLGYLTAQPGKVHRREWLAELLWPGLDASSGRANLRVVLADVQAVFKALGLSAALETQRDWLLFIPDGCLRTDQWAMQHWLMSSHGELRSLSDDGIRQDWLTLRRAHRWLDGAESSVSSDFEHWLATQRQRLTDAILPRALPEALASDAARAVQRVFDGPVLAPVAVLRIDLMQPLAGQVTEDPAAIQVVESCLSLLDDLAAGLSGQRLRHDDAGFLYGFGLRSLHAGYLTDALRFAVRASKLLMPSGQIRSGLTFGPALVIKDAEVPVSGWRLRLAERLALSGEDGQLVCDQSCGDLTQLLPFVGIGVRQFRGIHGVFDLFAVGLAALRGFEVWSLPPLVESRPPLVGRNTAMAALERAWGVAVRQSSASLCLTGPSGIGKSRVAIEFAWRRAAEGCRVVWMGGKPESATEPWSVVRGVLASLTGWEQGTDLVQPDLSWVGPSDGGASDAVRHLLQHRHVPSTARAGLLRALTACVAGCPGSPSLVVLDDVHWFDEPSLVMLGQLAANASQVMWLCSSWTDTAGACADLARSLPNLIRHVLEPLSDADALELLMATQAKSEDALQGDACDNDVEHEQRRRLQDARGLPLYLLCQGAGATHSGYFDAYCHAQCNRLGSARSVFDVAAVCGMLFAVADVAQVCDPEMVQQALQKGGAVQWLVKRGADQYAFFHPALRDYLLRSLPRDVFVSHAARVAKVFQSRGAMAKAAGLWEQAGAWGEARAAWQQGAQMALAVDDANAACVHFAHLERLSYGDADQSIELKVQHAMALVACKGYGFAKVHSMALELAQLTDAVSADQTLRFKLAALAYLGSSSQGRVDGIVHADGLVALAVTPAQQMAAAWAEGNTRLWLGDARSAIEWLQRCVLLAQQVPLDARLSAYGTDPAVFGRVQLAWMLWMTGSPAPEVQRHIDIAAEIANASTTIQDVCVFHSMAAFVRMSQGDISGLLNHAGRALAVAESEDFALWRAIAGLQCAVGEAWSGTMPDLPALLTRVAGVGEAYQAGLTTALWMVATIHHACQQWEAVLVVTGDVLDHVDGREHRYCLMDIWRLRADAQAHLGQPDAAARSMSAAIGFAVAKGLKGWLVRWLPADAAA